MFTAAVVPRPSEPATGKTVVAPWDRKAVVSDAEVVWSVKEPMKVPFWVFSFHPSTVTGTFGFIFVL